MITRRAGEKHSEGSAGVEFNHMAMKITRSYLDDFCVFLRIRAPTCSSSKTVASLQEPYRHLRFGREGTTGDATVIESSTGGATVIESFQETTIHDPLLDDVAIFFIAACQKNALIGYVDDLRDPLIIEGWEFCPSVRALVGYAEVHIRSSSNTHVTLESHAVTA